MEGKGAGEENPHQGVEAEVEEEKDLEPVVSVCLVVRTISCGVEVAVHDGQRA